MSWPPSAWAWASSPAGDGATAALTDDGVLRSLLGMAGYLTAIALMGLGLGILLRSAASGIGVLIGGVILLPTLAEALLPASLDSVSKFLPSSAAAAFTTVGGRGDDVLGATAGALVLAAWVAVTLGASVLDDYSSRRLSRLAQRRATSGHRGFSAGIASPGMPAVAIVVLVARGGIGPRLPQASLARALTLETEAAGTAREERGQVPSVPHDERVHDQRVGRVEVIAGPMFAGKTEELLRRVRRAAIAGQRVVVFSHSLDTRAGGDRIASHAGLDAPSRAVGSAEDIVTAVESEDLDIVAIDEAQFFGPPLEGVVQDLAAKGLHIIVAGLDVTFLGRPFEPLPALMAQAERVDKLTAVCSVCGADAIFHARVAPSGESDVNLVTENVGGRETYQALCRRHFTATPTA